MVFSSVRSEVAKAQMILPLYGKCEDGENLDDFAAYVVAKMSYTNEEAQSYLRRVTKPCFDSLHQSYEQLSKGDLAKMRESLDESTQICDRLVGLEKSRAKIQKSEQEALEAIEQEIEGCLGAADETKRSLRNSMFEVESCLSDMRECLSVYDKLLQHLEDHGKEQHYQQLITKLEEECDSCRSHPIHELDVDQKRSDLLGHLRNKRWREERPYQVTRADVLEMYYTGR